MKRIIAIALLLLFAFSATTALNAETADKNKLRELLTDTYDAEQYTPESYEEYRNARKYAFEVYEYADALPVQVETAMFARLLPIRIADRAVVNFSVMPKAIFAVLLPPSAARRRRILLEELKAISEAEK